VQKLRRLEQITATIQQLRALQSEGRPLELPLANALEEEQRLRSWISTHEHRRT
jgi:hypothetical protein